MNRLKEKVIMTWNQIKKDRKTYLKESKGSFVKRIPNTLTEIRIICSIFIPILMQISKEIAILFAIFIALTDFFDGLIARTCNACSNYGAFLDTFADKLLSLALILSFVPRFPIYAFFILLGETSIAITNTLARVSGRITKSTLLGKIKTWFVSIAAISALILMMQPKIEALANTFLFLATIFEYITLADYLRIYHKNKKSK